MRHRALCPGPCAQLRSESCAPAECLSCTMATRAPPTQLVLVVLVLLTVSWCARASSSSCQLAHDWRPQSESCRAELAEIIVFARVLAVHQEQPYSLYNYLPWQLEDTGGLFFSAEIELLCDQAWGSMLEVPAGSRFNVTGLGYFPCYSYSVVENNNYYFFLRMDENYSIIPHGVNFQDPIFPDTPENHRMFASLFQFSNCTAGTQVHMYTPEWEAQEDSRLLCSTVQKALFEEEEKVKDLSQKVKVLEKANNHLRDKVKNMKRLLRQAKRETKDQTVLLKQLHESEPELPHPHQDTTQEQKPAHRKVLPRKLKN